MHEQCMDHYERISEFLDGELDEKTCEEIRSHLKECPECLRCVESLQKTISLLKSTPSDPVPADTRKRLRETLRECLSQAENPAPAGESS